MVNARLVWVGNKIYVVGGKPADGAVIKGSEHAELQVSLIFQLKLVIVSN